MGIDNGSQSTKVGIFDEHGQEICYGSYQLKPTQTPRPGVVFHPDDDLWVSVTGAIQNCLDNFQGDRTEIKAIGLCTIRCCRALLDSRGELVEPVISWMDQRMSTTYVHQDDAVKYVTTTSGYLAHKMTGQFKDTCSNQEAYWPMDWTTLQWGDDEMIAAHGLKREMLFELIKPGEVYGALKPELARQFGLNTGIKVIATGNDKAVETLGAGLTNENELMISLGTFISANMYRHAYFPDAQNFFPTLACEPFKYVYESTGIRRGMWTVSWFKQIAGEDVRSAARERHIPEEEVMNEWAGAVPPGSDGLITVLDWLSPPSHPFRKGMMIGFDQRHTKAHMYRSILESIALTLKLNVDLMTQEVGAKLEHVTAIGGGSKSDVLMQIIADVFGLDVKRQAASSSACLGSCMCAAVGLGWVKSFDEAKARMARSARVFSPIAENTALYSRLSNEVFKDIKRHTDPILEKTFRIVN